MCYKVKYEKSNFILMTSLLFLCLFTCIFWLLLNEYTFSIIYFILTLIIAIIYYGTRYYLKDNHLKIRLGFIAIKIKYKNIKEIVNLKNSVKIKTKYFSIDIYPSNKDMFYGDLKNKVS